MVIKIDKNYYITNDAKSINKEDTLFKTKFFESNCRSCYNIVEKVDTDSIEYKVIGKEIPDGDNGYIQMI